MCAQLEVPRRKCVLPIQRYPASYSSSMNTIKTCLNSSRETNSYRLERMQRAQHSVFELFE